MQSVFKLLETYAKDGPLVDNVKFCPFSQSGLYLVVGTTLSLCIWRGRVTNSPKMLIVN